MHLERTAVSWPSGAPIELSAKVAAEKIDQRASLTIMQSPSTVPDTIGVAENPPLNGLTDAISYIFSWVILMPIAVIVSGKLMAQRLKLVSSSKQLFKIPIPGVLTIQARNDEVILGFAGFLVTLVVVGFIGGPTAYKLMIERFGIDPGHFNSLCVVSAFLTVLWSFVVFIVSSGGGGGDFSKEHEELINELAQRKSDHGRE